MSDIDKDYKNESIIDFFNYYSVDLSLNLHAAAFAALAYCVPGWAG
jgi:hypothetical protein